MKWLVYVWLTLTILFWIMFAVKGILKKRVSEKANEVLDILVDVFGISATMLSFWIAYCIFVD
jgi:hypothetical protein